MLQQKMLEVSHANVHERPIAYNRNIVLALAFPKIIVGIPNSCHHQIYLKFPRAYALRRRYKYESQL